MKSARSNLVVVGALLALCLPLQWITRERAFAHGAAADTYEQFYYLPSPKTLATFAMGHREALATLIWVRGLVYLGEETVRNLPAEHIFRYADAVVGLDPYFSGAYRVFAIAAQSRPSLSPEEATARIRRAVELLERGVRALPNDGPLAWDTGAMYAYTLAPRLQNLSQYREAKVRGLEHMQAATVRGAGPPWAGVANASTLVRLGQTEQAITHLQELYAITSDPAVRESIEAQLAHLRSEAFMEGLREVSAEVSRNHKRDFPYVSETLYLLLGSRPPFDRMAWLSRWFDPVAGAQSPGTLSHAPTSQPDP